MFAVRPNGIDELPVATGKVQDGFMRIDIALQEAAAECLPDRTLPRQIPVPEAMAVENVEFFASTQSEHCENDVL